MNSFYGNLKNNSRASFIFDKIYPTRKAMEDAVKNGTDGVFVNRYVLIAYNYTQDSATYDVKNYSHYDYNSYLTEDENYGKIENPVYVAHRDIDILEYGSQYDKTVWIKIYSNNEEKYIQVGALNAAAPAFELVIDAPGEDQGRPHFDYYHSGDLTYTYHTPKIWEIDLNRYNSQIEKDDSFFEKVKEIPAADSEDWLNNDYYYKNAENNRYYLELSESPRENVEYYQHSDKYNYYYADLINNNNLTTQHSEYPYVNSKGFQSIKRNYDYENPDDISFTEVPSGVKYPDHVFFVIKLTKDTYMRHTYYINTEYKEVQEITYAANTYYYYDTRLKRYILDKNSTPVADRQYFTKEKTTNYHLTGFDEDFDPSETYYVKTQGSFEEMDSNTPYKANKFFYQDENGNYILDSNDTDKGKTYPDKTYYEFVIGYPTSVQDDTKRLDVELPSIGNAISDVYDTIYGRPLNPDYPNGIKYIYQLTDETEPYPYQEYADETHNIQCSIDGKYYYLTAEEWEAGDGTTPEPLYLYYDENEHPIPVYNLANDKERPYTQQQLFNFLNIEPYNNVTPNDPVSVAWGVEELKKYISELRYLSHGEVNGDFDPLVYNGNGLQSDWAVDDATAFGYIYNKPTVISHYIQSMSHEAIDTNTWHYMRDIDDDKHVPYFFEGKVESNSSQPNFQYTKINYKAVNPGDFVYEPNKYYYLNIFNQYVLDTNDFMTQDRQYYRLGDYILADATNYEAGKYYYRQDVYKLDTNGFIVPDRKYYVPADVLFRANHIQYEPNKYYYFVPNQYILDVNNSKNPNQQYYIPKTYELIDNFEYEPNTYYYKENGQYILDTQEFITPDQEYYVPSKYMMLPDDFNYEPNKYYYCIPGGYILDENDTEDPDRLYYDLSTYYECHTDGFPFEVIYEPNEYFYKLEEYILDTNSEKTPDRDYYIFEESQKVAIPLSFKDNMPHTYNNITDRFLYEVADVTTHYVFDEITNYNNYSNISVSNVLFSPQLIYKPINLTEETYEPNKYYFLSNSGNAYILDRNTSMTTDRQYYTGPEYLYTAQKVATELFKYVYTRYYLKEDCSDYYPNKYYYKDIINGVGVYILDNTPNTIDHIDTIKNREYYIRSDSSKNTVDSEIALLPFLGLSGRLIYQLQVRTPINVTTLSELIELLNTPGYYDNNIVKIIYATSRINNLNNNDGTTSTTIPDNFMDTTATRDGKFKFYTNIRSFKTGLPIEKIWQNIPVDDIIVAEMYYDISDMDDSIGTNGVPNTESIHVLESPFISLNANVDSLTTRTYDLEAYVGNTSDDSNNSSTLAQRTAALETAVGPNGYDNVNTISNRINELETIVTDEHNGLVKNTTKLLDMVGNRDIDIDKDNNGNIRRNTLWNIVGRSTTRSTATAIMPGLQSIIGTPDLSVTATLSDRIATNEGNIDNNAQNIAALQEIISGTSTTAIEYTANNGLIDRINILENYVGDTNSLITSDNITGRVMKLENHIGNAGSTIESNNITGRVIKLENSIVDLNKITIGTISTTATLTDYYNNYNYSLSDRIDILDDLNDVYTDTPIATISTTDIAAAHNTSFEVELQED